MSLEHDDRDREPRKDWGAAAELPLGNESAAQRLSKRVKPGKRGRIDPTILGALVLVAIVGGVCAYGSLYRGPETEVAVAEEETPAQPLSPEEAVRQQGLAAGAGAPAGDPAAVSAAPLGQPVAPATAVDPAAAQPDVATAPLGAPAPAPGSALEEEVVDAPEIGAPAAKQLAMAQPGAAAAKLPAGAFRVQLLAMSSEQAAQRAWTDLAKSHQDLLGRLSPNVVRADLGAKGTVYRVQAGPLADRASADQLCGALAKRGTGCIVVVN
jgi:cell division septation protein DedD